MTGSDGQPCDRINAAQGHCRSLAVTGGQAGRLAHNPKVAGDVEGVGSGVHAEPAAVGAAESCEARVAVRDLEVEERDDPDASVSFQACGEASALVAVEVDLDHGDVGADDGRGHGEVEVVFEGLAERPVAP